MVTLQIKDSGEPWSATLKKIQQSQLGHTQLQTHRATGGGKEININKKGLDRYGGR